MKFLVSEERAWWIKTLNEFKFHNNLHLDFIFVLGIFCPFFIDFHHQYYNNYNFMNILSGIWVHKHLFFDEALWVHESRFNLALKIFFERFYVRWRAWWLKKFTSDVDLHLDFVFKSWLWSFFYRFSFLLFQKLQHFFMIPKIFLQTSVQVIIFYFVIVWFFKDVDNFFAINIIII